MGEGDDKDSLAYSPTWVVAAVCTFIIAISLSVERILHYTGSHLKRKNMKPLYEALHKVEEELMLLGFISLLLAVFQDRISKICIPPEAMHQMLPCTGPQEKAAVESEMAAPPVYPGAEFDNQQSPPPLLGFHDEGAPYCAKKGKMPILSVHALHHLHIFIFTLATVHITSTLITLIFGVLRIRQWKIWEDEIAKASYQTETESGITDVQQHDFIKSRFKGIGKRSTILGWLHSFAKQFYGSVTKTDYMALRLGFIMTHCRGNPKFNFHKYMIRALEDDFKKVVGIRWYLWIFVILFLLLNIHNWHTYFWVSFIHFGLVIAVGTKLQHVIIQLAHEVAEKHAAIEGELVVHPSDDHFWFHRPRIILYLLHFILFQNAFEIAFFFLIWTEYGIHSCIMEKSQYFVPRLVIGFIIQLLCSYSTLPLYAIVTQMGSHFKQSIFDDHIRASLVDWAQKAKQRQGQKAAANAAGDEGSSSTATGVQTGEIRSANNQDQSAIDIRQA
ncbi:PREDICTED: MLO-like protein 1 [Ipomoea nil]|uniref:MLO-like protein 1 n=1 Tax=Ipomoea nil TaxID=35883 RepID=UPI00090186CE|nr:PREDICTED: MLO-like protein 1 [Ipomoea nil]